MPNCGESVKGLLSNELIEQSKVDFINKHLNKNKEGYCPGWGCVGSFRVYEGIRGHKATYEGLCSPKFTNAYQ
jgi:hypothetical protein